MTDIDTAGPPAQVIGAAATASRPAAPRRVLMAAIPAGVALDIVLRSDGVGAAMAMLPLVVAALLVVTGAVSSRSGLLALVPVCVISPWLAVRANSTVQTLDVLACACCLALAVSAGRCGGMVTARGSGRAGRLGDVAAGIVDGPRFAVDGVRVRTGGRARSTLRSVLRGICVATPLALVVGALLADADRSFAALFGAERFVDGFLHVALAIVGATLFVGLARTGLSRRQPSVWSYPTVGDVEASVVVGVLVLLYSLFALTRVMQPSGADEELTRLADEARAGFFQLLAVVVITVLLLTAVRLMVVSPGRWLTGLSVTAVALTLVIVGVAIHRLQRYRDEFGLTQLRLGTTWVSAWLGVIIAVVGLTFVLRLSNRWLLNITVFSALALLVVWNVSNPDATIARTNIERAAEGKRFDPEFLGAMSADAVPTIVANLDRIPADRRDTVITRLCATHDLDDLSATSWNLSRARAVDALRPLCTP